MSKVVINDFLMKLGFDGKEVSKGLDQLEKRILKMNQQVERSQKAVAKGEKEHIALLKMKQDLKIKQANRKKAELKLSKETFAVDKNGVDLQIKLGRLEKISLDIESKRLRILQQQKAIEGGILIKNEQIKRAKLQTSSAEERAAYYANRRANSSERAARANSRSAMSLRRSVDSANKMQNFLLKGALAYTALSVGKTVVGDTLTEGLASSRARVGLDAVSDYISPYVNAQNRGEFTTNQNEYATNLALKLNRDIVSTQEAWRNTLGASIGIIEEHGAEGFSNIKDAFQGVIESAAVFKLSKEHTRLMLLGLTQSLQKGKLQADEIVQQMAERSPLALGALVKAIRTVKKDQNITTADMYRMMEAGDLLAYDIMPEFGRNMSKISNELAKGDLEGFMSKSAAGALDGVNAALQLIQVGAFDTLDEPMSRLLGQVKELLLNLDFVWKPASVWLSNIFDLANEDLKAFIQTAKNGTGIFKDLWGFAGGQIGWDERTKNMTPEEQRKNSEAMFEKSKKFYEGIRSFMVGDRDKDKMGGFLGGIIDFFSTAIELVNSLKGAIESLMESLGLERDKVGNMFTADNIGWLSGVWLTSNLTGATNMFVAMGDAFVKMATALDAFSSPATLAMMTGLLNAFTGEGGGMAKVEQIGDILNSDASHTEKFTKTIWALTAEPALKKVSKNPLDWGKDAFDEGMIKVENIFAKKSYDSFIRDEEISTGLMPWQKEKNPFYLFQDPSAAPEYLLPYFQAVDSYRDKDGFSAIEQSLGRLSHKEQLKYMTSEVFIKILQNGVTTEEVIQIQQNVDNIINLDISY